MLFVDNGFSLEIIPECNINPEYYMNKEQIEGSYIWMEKEEEKYWFENLLYLFSLKFDFEDKNVVKFVSGLLNLLGSYGKRISFMKDNIQKERKVKEWACFLFCYYCRKLKIEGNLLTNLENHFPVGFYF